VLGFHYSDRTGSTYHTGHVALTDVTAWSLITADEAYEWLRFHGIERAAVQRMDRLIGRLTEQNVSTGSGGQLDARRFRAGRSRGSPRSVQPCRCRWSECSPRVAEIRCSRVCITQTGVAGLRWVSAATVSATQDQDAPGP